MHKNIMVNLFMCHLLQIVLMQHKIVHVLKILLVLLVNIVLYINYLRMLLLYISFCVTSFLFFSRFWCFGVFANVYPWSFFKNCVFYFCFVLFCFVVPRRSQNESYLWWLMLFCYVFVPFNTFLILLQMSLLKLHSTEPKKKKVI